VRFGRACPFELVSQMSFGAIAAAMLEHFQAGEMPSV
jgi:hypothetical protein